jgi:hypothetical protein
MIRRYTLMTLLTAVISVGLGLGLTILHGLLGTVIAGSAIFAMRNLINYGFMTLILRERRQSTV